MFIDSVRIQLKAGKGGHGCRSLYRDKWTRHPLRNGGDGGKGADIKMVADAKIHTLLDFRYQQHFKAPDGGHGSSNRKQGKDGLDLVIKVPCGTVIRDTKSSFIIRDLKEDGEHLIVAKGGRGGRGNYSTKNEAEPGSAGQELEVSLELKLIADVAIIGLPNAGKSSLLRAISRARPKVADYPFTTTAPILGVYERSEFSCVFVDIPGLIEGAHAGKGLGDKFLRHIERTRVVVHLVDVSAASTSDPATDFDVIDQELRLYGAGLDKKPRIVAANKIDLPGWQKNLALLRAHVEYPVLAISCLKQKGLERLINEVKRIL
jgi:GTP-binding protein